MSAYRSLVTLSFFVSLTTSLRVPQDVLQCTRSLSSDYHWVAVGGSLQNSGAFVDTVRRIFEEQTGYAFVKHGSGKKYGATVNGGDAPCTCHPCCC
eukprot:6659046-Prymnesium_polylepis.1